SPLRNGAAGSGRGRLNQGGNVFGMGGDGVEDDECMGDEGKGEYGHEDQDGLLGPAQGGRGKQDYVEEDGYAHVDVESRRQKAEDGIGAGGDGDGQGQDIVDQQGAPANHAHGGIEQFAGAQISAAAGRKEFDDLGIAGADQEYCNDGEEGDDQTQMGMMAQGQEGVFRSVTGRGKAVGTQADPGEKGDQAYAVERSLVRRVQRLSENEDFEFLERIRTRNILHL